MSLRLRKIIQIGSGVLIVLLIILFVVLQIRINNITQAKAELEEKLLQYQEKLDELNYKNSLSEEEYIKRYAREVLGYHSQDEIIFKFDYDE